MTEYGRLSREQERPKRAVDHRDAWERLMPLLGVNGVIRERVEAFAISKRISMAALFALGTRVKVDDHGGIELAWGYEAQTRDHPITAVKFRPIGDKKRYTLKPSVFVEPLVVGNIRSLDWVIAEGESDACRLYDLVGDVAAIICAPAGALTWKRAWGDLIPRGAVVHLCHDADKYGDEGALKAATLITGRTVRVRPPVEGADWCDLDLDRERFVQLVAAARAESDGLLDVMTARELCALPDGDDGEQLLGPIAVRGQRIVIGAHTGEGKTSISLQIVHALSSGGEFLDWTGAGGRVLVLDAEQGLRTVKRRLREAGLADSDAVDYVRVPDGLALDGDPAHVAAVEAVLEQGEYALVVADPLYKLHQGDSNDEREAVDLMRRFDGWRERYGFALLLPVHCRKPVPGMKFSIHDLFGSSAYVRGAEVVLGLRRVSDGYAKLHFLKDRDGDLPIGTAWGLLFDQERGFRRDPDDGKTRDLAAELLDLLADGSWRTMSELRRSTEKGGVGADPTTLQPVLDDLTAAGTLEYQVGPEGRRRDAKCWRAKCRDPLDDTSDTSAFSKARGEAKGISVVVSSPLGRRHNDDTSPDTERADTKCRHPADDTSADERTLDEALAAPTFITGLISGGIITGGPTEIDA